MEALNIPAEAREKIKIPTPTRYNGRRDPDTLRNWLYDYTNYTAFHNIPEGQKILLLPYYLEGPAADWWSRRRANAEIPNTWAGVEHAIRAEFLPQNHENRIRRQWTSLRQITSVAAYSAEFRKLLLSLPPMDNAIVLHQYVEGLKPQTRLEVEMSNPRTLNEAEVQALRVDDILFSRMKRQNPQNPKDPHPKPHTYPTPLANVNTTPRGNGLPKLTDAERARLRASGSCFRCRQQGHRADQCPLRNTTGQQGNTLPPRPRQRLNVVEAAVQTPAHQLGNEHRQ